MVSSARPLSDQAVAGAGKRATRAKGPLLDVARKTATSVAPGTAFQVRSMRLVLTGVAARPDGVAGDVQGDGGRVAVRQALGGELQAALPAGRATTRYE